MRLILAQGLPQSGLKAHLQQRRAHVAAHRNSLEELSGESGHAGEGWQLALDYGLALADTQLEWLDRSSDRTLERFAKEVVRAARVGNGLDCVPIALCTVALLQAWFALRPVADW